MAKVDQPDVEALADEQLDALIDIARGMKDKPFQAASLGAQGSRLYP